jgi:hypothetical protein
VQIAVGLRLDRLHDGGMTVARVLAADAAREVDERAAVDVCDARALGLGDDQCGRRDARRHVLRALLGDALGGCVLTQ